MENAFTIDVEDYFHVSAFAENVSKASWSAFPSRVETNTRLILDLLSECDIVATFFVLGWVAERQPGLIRDIQGRGHEVACHGYSHDLIYTQSPELFRSETLRAKAILEDTIGEPVCGYRAASYSITRQSLWALEIIAEAGFAYDSSIFPIRHDRYGIDSAPRAPFRIDLGEGRSLTEFPLTTFRRFGMTLPVAGGGYFRLFPYAYTRAGLQSVHRNDRMPAIFYIHPWEIDVDQPRLQGSLISRFRHYTNIKRCKSRLSRLLREFRWNSVANVLKPLKCPSLTLDALA